MKKLKMMKTFKVTPEMYKALLGIKETYNLENGDMVIRWMLNKIFNVPAPEPEQVVEEEKVEPVECIPIVKEEEEEVVEPSAVDLHKIYEEVDKL